MFPILDTIQERWHPGEWKGKCKMTFFSNSTITLNKNINLDKSILVSKNVGFIDTFHFDCIT